MRRILDAPDRLRAAAERRAQAILDWLLGHGGSRWRKTVLLGKRAVLEFRDDECPRLASSVAYHVLFSLFPLIIFVVAVFGLLVSRDTVRQGVLDTVTTYIPLTESGQRSLFELVAELQGGSTALGLIGIVGVVYAAGGMMGAVRRALTLAFDASEYRPFIRGKLIDLLLVLGAGIVLAASFALTVAVRVAAGNGYSQTGWLSFLGPFVGAAGWLIGVLVPFLMAFALFSFLFAVVPAVRSRFRDVWPGAVVGAALFQVLKEGFAVYLANFAHYNLVYGSLGAVAAFIFFVYLSANAMLFGAEVASEYPRVRREQPRGSAQRG